MTGGVAESVVDGGERRARIQDIGGRNPEKRGIGTRRKKEISSIVVCVRVNGGCLLVPGNTNPPREKGNGT